MFVWTDAACKSDGSRTASVDENAASAVAIQVSLTGLTGGHYRIKSQSKFDDATGCQHSAPYEVLSNGRLRLKSAVSSGLSAESCTGYEVEVAYNWNQVDVTTCKI